MIPRRSCPGRIFLDRPLSGSRAAAGERAPAAPVAADLRHGLLERALARHARVLVRLDPLAELLPQRSVEVADLGDLAGVDGPRLGLVAAEPRPPVLQVLREPGRALLRAAVDDLPEPLQPPVGGLELALRLVVAAPACAGALEPRCAGVVESGDDASLGRDRRHRR